MIIGNYDLHSADSNNYVNCRRKGKKKKKIQIKLEKKSKVK